MDLSADHFADFFAELWGFDRFDWQQRMAGQVLDRGRWPDVVDLPTGSGKTSLLDLAVFALAVRPDVFSRRVVFVVDRRLIVDQVTERARAVRERLLAASSPVLQEVACRLRALSASDEPLVVAGLRGGRGVSGSWAQWPDQPAVVVSTVDQMGSRLLFRGYGVSKGMRPVHAGLAANDCTVLLDEVHISRPFAATLASTRRYRQSGRLPDRFQVVEMSATPQRSNPLDWEFRLDVDVDLAPGTALAERVLASKQCRLLELGKQAHTAEQVLSSNVDTLLSALPEHAKVVGVVVNRVATARAVAAALGRQDPLLLTGRMRPHERAAVVKAAMDLADPDREVVHGGRTVVVATQCIEVGADLSFDALITEAAPVDALRQRFGRLDRRGTLAKAGRPASAVIVGVASAITGSDDPVYGAALAGTWMALKDAHAERPFDVGPLSDQLVGVSAPTMPYPMLLPAHLDALVQTSPEPAAPVDVATFLHGFVDADTDVDLVWRADIEGYDGDDPPPGLLFCPPHRDEMLSVPMSAVRHWLRGQSSLPVADADARIDEGEKHHDPQSDTDIWCWRSRDDIRRIDPSDIRPGDVVIVPTTRGGLTNGTWDPASDATVTDIGDEARIIDGRPEVRRIIPDVVAPATRVAELVSALESSERAIDEAGVVRAWAEGASAVLGDGAFQAALAAPFEVRTYDAGLEITAIALVWKSTAVAEPDQLDGTDTANSFLGRSVSLRSHLAGVGTLARQMAERLGLPSSLQEDLELAGRLHDIGKADERFQLRLFGSEIDLAMAEELIAKSSRHSRLLRGGDPYPPGMRHEMLSVAMVESNEAVLSAAHDPELVMHLVATHHGHARPWPPLVPDPDPRPVTFEMDGAKFMASSDTSTPRANARAVDRFWRLVRRYGWFELAWLEAVFRLADHRRSQLEQGAGV